MHLPDFSRTDFFIAVAANATSANSLPAFDQRTFASAISIRAVEEAGADGDGELLPVIEAPGYLHRRIEDWDIFVPFNLASVFPGSALLVDTVNIARAARLHDWHPICISGSTTFLGRMKNAVDLDFCEYYMTSSGEIGRSVAEKMKQSTPLILVEVKCASRTFDLAAATLAEDLHTMLHLHPKRPPANTLKLDFIGTVNGFGILPVTSVILPVSADRPDENNAADSFPYQEAVVTPLAPPRSLLRPSEFARYAAWLRTEAIRWHEAPEHDLKAPLKCLKRILSLLLLLGYDPPAPQLDERAAEPGEGPQNGAIEYLLGVMNAGPFARIADHLRREELRKLVEIGSPDNYPDVRRWINQDSPLDQTVVEHALTAAREIAAGLIDLLEVEFTRAERRPT